MASVLCSALTARMKTLVGGSGKQRRNAEPGPILTARRNGKKSRNHYSEHSEFVQVVILKICVVQQFLSILAIAISKLRLENAELKKKMVIFLKIARSLLVPMPPTKFSAVRSVRRSNGATRPALAPVVCKADSGETATGAFPQRGANTRSALFTGCRSAFVVPQHPAQPRAAHHLALVRWRVVPGRLTVPQQSVPQSLAQPFQIVLFGVL